MDIAGRIPIWIMEVRIHKCRYNRRDDAYMDNRGDTDDAYMDNGV